MSLAEVLETGGKMTEILMVTLGAVVLAVMAYGVYIEIHDEIRMYRAKKQWRSERAKMKRRLEELGWVENRPPQFHKRYTKGNI